LTQCTELGPELQLNFDFGLGKQVVGQFDAGRVSSDGGLVLLGEVDNRLRLTEQIVWCIGDKRKTGKVRHKMLELVRQRVYMIASGYEDANDANSLKSDPLHKICAGRSPETDPDLASQPTLSRLENSITEKENKFLQDMLIHLYIQQFKRPPQRVLLDMDTTCDEVHGYQQLSFYNGFYKTDCYTPLFVFADRFPVAAMLRAGNAAPAEGAVRALKPVITALRQAWPEVIIDLRADAGFCTPELYRFCEENKVFYFIGIKTNSHLALKARPLIDRAKQRYIQLHGPLEQLTTKQAKKQRDLKWRQKQERIRFADKKQGRMQEHFEDEDGQIVRVIDDIPYQADHWNSKRRVIGRCDYTSEGPDMRYIVTNHFGGRPRWAYEDKYCKRGRCENYIKELKALKCDRLSCQEFEANQFRLLLHTFAYILMQKLSELVSAQAPRMSVNTVRLRFLKIGVLVKETSRKIWLHWTSHYPWQSQFNYLTLKLQC
jgi:hypothetical protein